MGCVSVRDADSVRRGRQGGRGPLLSGPKRKGKPLNRLPRFVVQHPTLPGGRVQEKGFGKSLGLRRWDCDHLVAPGLPDFRLLAARAAGRSQKQSERRDYRLLHWDCLSGGLCLSRAV
jgi:hypothetical protein